MRRARPQSIAVVSAAVAALMAAPPSPSSAASAHAGRAGDAALSAFAGFSSPYLGHTGSNAGDGTACCGGSKTGDMDVERSMGLQWTFVSIYWSVMESDGPTDPDHDPGGHWRNLDAFVAAAHGRGLNVLLQITVGGNAGGPPDWAGEREEGQSAPANMDALIDFVGKLVARYRPDGDLAQERGWTDGYGIRAWEMDNEPSSYLTNWGQEADDYAEFVTKAGDRIGSIDPDALVVAPALATGEACPGEWGDEILQAGVQAASDFYQDRFRQTGEDYVAGPSIDVVSFHNYELLSQAFYGCEGPTDDQQLQASRDLFHRWESQPGHEYAPKSAFWQTEGDLSFVQLDGDYLANWQLQEFARVFAAGITKAMVMDANGQPERQAAVRTMIQLLPDPSSMTDVTGSLGYSRQRVSIYRVTRPSDAGWTYLLWAANRSLRPMTVRLPVRTTSAQLVTREGQSSTLQSSNGKVSVRLAGGIPYSEPVFVVEG